MMGTNPTMGGAPPMVDKPVLMLADIEAAEQQLRRLGMWPWLTDGLAVPWIKEVRSCDTGLSV